MVKGIVSKPVRSAGGFVSGFHYPIRAAVFIVRHPSLWVYCLVPFLINAIVVSVLWIFLGEWSQAYISAHVSGSGWWWTVMREAAVLLALVVRVVATLVGFVVIGSFAALPFNDLLSERTDKLASGWEDPRPFSLWRMVSELTVTGTQEGRRMSIYLVIVIALFALSFIPVLAPITEPMKVFVTAMFFAADYLSYPLERRGALMFRDKMKFARKVTPVSFGFGCAITLIFLIPFVNFLFFPLAVVGGTLLFADLIAAEPERLAEGMPERFRNHLLYRKVETVSPDGLTRRRFPR